MRLPQGSAKVALMSKFYEERAQRGDRCAGHGCLQIPAAAVLPQAQLLSGLPPSCESSSLSFGDLAQLPCNWK